MLSAFVLLSCVLLVARAQDTSCFVYQQNYDFENSAVAGPADVQLTIDTASLIPSKLASNCSDLRIKQAGGSVWLNYWFETSCNSAATRIWVTANAVALSNLTLEVYYHCIDQEGAVMDPPGGPTTLPWGGNFIVMANSTTACGATGWAAAPEMTGRFFEVSNAATYTELPGGFETHMHHADDGLTTGVVLEAPSGHTGAGAIDVCEPNHVHSLKDLDVTVADEGFPPFYDIAYCKGQYLALEATMVFALCGADPSVSGYDLFTELNDRFPRGSATVGGTGGATEHVHTVSGSVNATVAGFVVARAELGTSVTLASASHQHDVTPGPTNAEPNNNLPPRYLAPYLMVTISGMPPIFPMGIMATTIPPRGFEVHPAYDGHFLLGQAAPSGPFTAVDHEHSIASGPTSLPTGVSPTFGAISGFASYEASAIHTHLLAFSTDTNGWYAYQQKRAQMPMLKYKSTRVLDGMHPNPEVQIKPLYSCSGRHWESSTVCSSHGNCTSQDTCTCDAQWGLANCSLFKCNGLLKNAPNVCSSRGTCSAPDVCTNCDAKWVGMWCEIPTCYGEMANESTACSDHGNCTWIDTCVCDDVNLWNGTQCENAVCYGAMAGYPGTCADNGLCIGPNQCFCNNYNVYGGLECDLAVCSGVLENETFACSSKGNCTSPGVCECDEPDLWGGSVCDNPKCYKLLEPAACMSHGTCQRNHTCWCLPDYGGQICNYTTCGGKASAAADVCNSRGDCWSLNNCTCNAPANWTGINCEIALCWYHPPGATACSGHGTCDVGTHQCGCQAQYGSYDCSKLRCSTFLAGDAGICSGRGTCLAYNDCTCNAPANWTGSDCETGLCYGKAVGAADACDGHGTCNGATHVCECDATHKGPECAELIATNPIVTDDDETLNSWRIGIIVGVSVVIVGGVVLIVVCVLVELLRQRRNKKKRKEGEGGVDIPLTGGDEPSAGGPTADSPSGDGAKVPGGAKPKPKPKPKGGAGKPKPKRDGSDSDSDSNSDSDSDDGKKKPVRERRRPPRRKPKEQVVVGSEDDKPKPKPKPKPKGKPQGKPKPKGKGRRRHKPRPKPPPPPADDKSSSDDDEPKPKSKPKPKGRGKAGPKKPAAAAPDADKPKPKPKGRGKAAPKKPAAAAPDAPAGDAPKKPKGRGKGAPKKPTGAPPPPPPGGAPKKKPKGRGKAAPKKPDAGVAPKKAAPKKGRPKKPAPKPPADEG